MERIETVHHRRRQSVYRKRSTSPCMNPSTKSTSQNWVWVPAIPSWEKEFCKKVGLFGWDDFLEAKKLTDFTPKVLEWNDFEAKEAFDRAKRRFFVKINNPQGYDDDELYSDPDLYIDEIDWEHDGDINHPDEMEFSRDESSDDDDEKEDVNIHKGFVEPDYYHVRIEDIKPTGWDIDVPAFSSGKVLTGLIVGR